MYFLGDSLQKIQGDVVQEEQTTVTVGTMIRGRYLVKDLLGKSDSGAIYLAEDQRTHSNLFALKEVIVQSKNELYRSLLEYQLLVHLDHPALAHVHSLLKDGQRHRAYLFMEYIEGSNLEILRQQQPEQRFSWLETMNIMASIIAAVSYLHGQLPPIIHGDIKPTNIIMPKAGGRAILVDFGTAKRYELDSRRGVINHAPTVCSCYRAPEQYTTGSDLQTDIYSLGATFYTLVTGNVPADAPSRLTQVSNGEIDPLQPVNEVLPTVPARVARAIDRAMALDADNRFLSVERFWEALWSLVEHPSSVPGDVPSASSHPPRIAKQAVVRPAVVSVPKQPRPPRAWKFGPFWPFAPKQAVARPATVSIPKYRHTPRTSIPAVTEQTTEEPAPVSVAEQPLLDLPPEPAVTEQEVEEPTPVSMAEHPQTAPELVTEHLTPVPSSELALQEPAVEEPAPVSVAEQPPLVLLPEPAISERVVEEPAPELVAEQPPPVLPSEPAVTEQVVEELAPVSVAEQPQTAPELVAEQPLLVLPPEPTVPEQVVEESTPALETEQPPLVLPSEPAAAEQVVEEPTPVSVAEQPQTAPELVAEQPPPVLPSEPAIPEQAVEEPAPTIEPIVADEAVEEPALVSVTEHLPPVPPSEPALQEQAVEESAPTFKSALTEQVAEEPTPVSVAEQPRMAPTFVTERPVEKSARASVAKPPRAPRTWRLIVLLIVVVSVIGLGISAYILSRVLTHPAASATLIPHIRSPKPTLAGVPSTYPTLAGTYKGTIFDIPANVRTSLTFTDVRQNQGHISGYLTVGPGLLGYGPFSGTIDTAKHLQFTVTDPDGNPTLFFEGAMQSATSLSGDYYRCNPAQGSPCVRGPVGYGLWNVQASSASGTSTGTNPSPGL